MLIDTDVLIWYMRGNKKALKTIESLDRFSISVITYMELVQGMRSKQELNILRNTLKYWGTELIYINEDISTKAMFYVEQHYLSHSIQLADALICATAVINGLPILTGNDKHYKAISNVIIKKFKPDS